MPILILKDGKRYRERCPNCRGIHITDRKEKGTYAETERYVCADCGHKAVAPALDRITVSSPSMIPEVSEEERNSLLPVPDETNGFLQEHALLLLKSFEQWIGRPLMGISLLTSEEQAQALFRAPFALVSHTTAADPVFNYANRQALALFEMSWEEFTRLPSRLSAEPVHQEERERLLSTVTHQGYSDNYRGIRIAKSGRQFWIENAIVWNLFDAEHRYCGQAAMFETWRFLTE